MARNEAETSSSTRPLPSSGSTRKTSSIQSCQSNVIAKSAALTNDNPTSTQKRRRGSRLIRTPVYFRSDLAAHALRPQANWRGHSSLDPSAGPRLLSRSKGVGRAIVRCIHGGPCQGRALQVHLKLAVKLATRHHRGGRLVSCCQYQA